MKKYQVNFLMCVIFFMIASLGWACPQPDLSGDCVVGFEDLVILAEQWLDPIGCFGHPTDCADFVGNDGVNLADLAVMAANWGNEGSRPVLINEIHYNPDLSYELV